MTTVPESTTSAKRSARRSNALPDGHLLGEYRLETVLGAGGFGVTYKAFDTHLETWVAIKEYFPIEWSFRDPDGVTVYANTQGQSSAVQGQSSDYEWGLERFLDEARVLAQVQHPNVVRIKRYFQAHGTAYIVMDYEEGDPLSAIIRDGETLIEEQIRGLLEDVLPALQAVHDQGYLHRDIKPSNLYVRNRDHRVMLIDFGAARAAISRHSQSVTSMVTPGYSPPEQYTTRNDRYGPWTDIYALGAVLYRCVTGQIPIEAADRLMEDTLQPAEEAGGGRYSTNLLRAIDRALAVWPEQRLRSVGEMEALLGGSQEQDSDETVIMMPLPKVSSKPVQDMAILRTAIEGAGHDRASVTQRPTESRTVGQRREVLHTPAVVSSPPRRQSILIIAAGGVTAVAAIAAIGLWLWPSTPVTDSKPSPSAPAVIAPPPAVVDKVAPAEIVQPAAPVADVAPPTEVEVKPLPDSGADTAPPQGETAKPSAPVAAPVESKPEPPLSAPVDAETPPPATSPGEVRPAPTDPPNAATEDVSPPLVEPAGAPLPAIAPSVAKPPVDAATDPVKAKPADNDKKPSARKAVEDRRSKASRQKARREQPQIQPQPIIVKPATPARPKPTAPQNNPWDSPASSGFNQK